MGIFLVHQGDTFELQVSGRLVGDSAAQSIVSAISYLPDGCSAVVDLSGVTDVDGHAVRAIDAALRERRRAGALLVLACPFGAVHATLLASGLATALAPSVAAARQSCSGLNVA